MQYSACYTESSAATGQCMGTFSEKVRRLTSMGYEDLEEESEELYKYRGEEEEGEGEEEDPEEVMCR